jgi:hypothetical protein
VGGAGPAVAENDYFPCFLYFPNAAPPPSSSSSSPASRTPLYTDACTSARGHRGEDNCFSPLVVAPAIEPRWNAPMLRAAAPPLVMPAFVPGWDEISCRCRRLHQRTCAVCLASPFQPS